MPTPPSAAWDHHADTYGRLFAPFTGVIARGLLALAEPRLPRGARLLDVACGTGALALPALERALRERSATDPGGAGAAAQVVATDFSEAMVAHTRAAGAAVLAGSPGAAADVFECRVENGEALSFADSSFDAVFSCFGIFLFGDRRAGWREAARVLRPGGTFATAVWQGPQQNELLRAQMEPMMAALPERLRQAPPPGGWLAIADADALRAEILEVAPLTHVRVRPFHLTMVYPDWTLLWGAMRDNPVVGTLLRACTEAELEVVRERVFAGFRERAGGDDEPLTLTSACNLLVATRP